MLIWEVIPPIYLEGKLPVFLAVFHLKKNQSELTVYPLYDHIQHFGHKQQQSSHGYNYKRLR